MSNGPKETFEALEYGNRWGKVTFGSLNIAAGGGLESDVLTGIGLQAFDSLHYIHLENDGPREGWMLQRCPGVWEVKCADSREKGEIGASIHVENGDFVIKAPNGRIRLHALDIDIRADGFNEKNGVINIDSNNSVLVRTGKFNAHADNGISLFSPKTVTITSNTTLKLVANFISGLSSAASKFGAKAFPTSNPAFKKINLFQ
jgi:hypothetical protein